MSATRFSSSEDLQMTVAGILKRPVIELNRRLWQLQTSLTAQGHPSNIVDLEVCRQLQAREEQPPPKPNPYFRFETSMNCNPVYISERGTPGAAPEEPKPAANVHVCGDDHPRCVKCESWPPKAAQPPPQP